MSTTTISPTTLTAAAAALLGCAPEALMWGVRTVTAGRRAHHNAPRGFQWPTAPVDGSGVLVTCPDWRPIVACGNGFHFAENGAQSSLIYGDTTYVWQLVAAVAAETVDIEGDKRKAPRVALMLDGAQEAVVAAMQALAPGAAVWFARRTGGVAARAALGSYSHAALGSDSHAALGSDSHAALGSDSHAALGSDSHAALGSDSHAALGSYSHAALGSDSHAALGSGSHAALGSDSHAALGSYSHAALGSYSHAALGSDSHAALGSGSHAALGSDSHAALGSGSHAALGSGSHAALGSYSHAALGSGSHAVGADGAVLSWVWWDGKRLRGVQREVGTEPGMLTPGQWYACAWNTGVLTPCDPPAAWTHDEVKGWQPPVRRPAPPEPVQAPNAVEVAS